MKWATSFCYGGTDAIRQLALLPQSILCLISAQVCESSTALLSCQDTILYKPGAHSSLSLSLSLSLCVVCVCVFCGPLWFNHQHEPTPLYPPQILSPLQCVDMQTNANRVHMFYISMRKKQSLILCQNRSRGKEAGERISKSCWDANGPVSEINNAEE